MAPWRKRVSQEDWDKRASRKDERAQHGRLWEGGFVPGVDISHAHRHTHTYILFFRWVILKSVLQRGRLASRPMDL